MEFWVIHLVAALPLPFMAFPWCFALFLGLARTVYIHRIWPYIWWFPCQKYRIHTVYIWFWPTQLILAHPVSKNKKWTVTTSKQQAAALPLALVHFSSVQVGALEHFNLLTSYSEGQWKVLAFKHFFLRRRHLPTHSLHLTYYTWPTTLDLDLRAHCPWPIILDLRAHCPWSASLLPCLKKEAEKICRQWKPLPRWLRAQGHLVPGTISSSTKEHNQKGLRKLQAWPATGSWWGLVMVLERARLAWTCLAA